MDAIKVPVVVRFLSNSDRIKEGTNEWDFPAEHHRDFYLFSFPWGNVKMNTVTEFSDCGLLQASYALKFIQRQLVELSIQCETTVQRELVCPQFFMELQDKLEKLLHETRSVCCPPPRKPEEGDFVTIKQFSSGSFGMLITSTGHIKVTDFGLSKIGPLNIAQDVQKAQVNRIVKEFTDKETVGSAPYMAPETIQESGYGKPVDWWALGIILFEFLVGDIPFDGNDYDDLFQHVIEDDIVWPEGEAAPSSDAQDLISLLLQKNAEIRLGTGGAGEVKAHPFFRGLCWRFLMDEEPPFIPQLRTEEDTSYFNSDADQQCQEDEGDEEPTVELPYLCSVAHRFTEVYSSPEHLSAPIAFNQIVVTRLVEEDEEEEEEQFNYYEGKFNECFDEQEQVDEGFEEEESSEEKEEDPQEERQQRRRATPRRRSERKKWRRMKKRRRYIISNHNNHYLNEYQMIV
ncbi:microtubule-associated serine/threonine-protein kinase 3-like [Scomber scombrus]|uniref:non-specific serine/threonine protein kinase n=1 Tax=Scomber scombrus TaxID=13677 RepID=A0AAV1PI61_SCOSC